MTSWLNRHRALAACLNMIFSENRFPLFGIMLEHCGEVMDFGGIVLSMRESSVAIVSARYKS
jgi:hypothetical protein